MSTWIQTCCLFLNIISMVYPTVASQNRSAEATYQLVFQDIQSYVSCFRRFNGTHEIGCSTGQDGNVGVIHYINDTNSLNWLIRDGPHHPYIPLMTSRMFTSKFIRKLKNSKKVNGIMVSMTDTYDINNYPKEFSSDLQCPNRESSIYKDDDEYSCTKHQYNPAGNGLMFEDMMIPIVVLKADYEVEKILSCYEKYNYVENGTEPDYPLCAIELKAFMFGAGNTEVCLRRSAMIRNLAPETYCQYLGGHSTVTFLDSSPKGTKRNKTIVVTVKTDSFSMFDRLQPGASSPVTGLVTFLAVVEAIKDFKEEIIAAGYNIAFFALTGESFDYIGSQKLVYDMMNEHFPNKTKDEEERMRLEDIHLIVELSQFIDGLKNRTIFTHTDPRTRRYHNETNEFIEVLKTVYDDRNITVREADAEQPLPPSSSQMFIRERKEGVPAVVLSDYNKKFNTMYYNSYLDTAAAHGFYGYEETVMDMYDNVTVQAEYLSEIASKVASALYSYTTGSSRNIPANNLTVNHIMYCLLVSPKCDLFYTIVSPDNTKVLEKTTSTFPMYVSVYQNKIDNHQYLIRQMMAYFSGHNAIGMSKENCTGYGGFWMNGAKDENGTRSKLCAISNTQYHNASSPAFEIDNYDFKSYKYSTWTESVWPANAFRVRLFLKPSTEVELACMVAGITLFIASSVIIVVIYRRTSVLFPSPVQTVENSLQPL